METNKKGQSPPQNPTGQEKNNREDLKLLRNTKEPQLPPDVSMANACKPNRLPSFIRVDSITDSLSPITLYTLSPIPDRKEFHPMQTDKKGEGSPHNPAEQTKSDHKQQMLQTTKESPKPPDLIMIHTSTLPKQKSEIESMGNPSGMEAENIKEPPVDIAAHKSSALKRKPGGIPNIPDWLCTLVEKFQKLKIDTNDQVNDINEINELTDNNNNDCSDCKLKRL